jgi:hypothetical protein
MRGPKTHDYSLSEKCIIPITSNVFVASRKLYYACAMEVFSVITVVNIIIWLM